MPDMPDSQQDLTLRDIAAVLSRYRRALLVTPLLFGLLAVAAVSLLPRTYSARTVVTFVTANRDAPASGAPNFIDPNQLPNLDTITAGFVSAAPSLLSRVWNTDPQDVNDNLDVSQQEDGAAVTIETRARTPRQAQQRAQQAAASYGRYTEDKIRSVVVESDQAARQNTRLDLVSSRATLATLRGNLAETPQVLPGRGQASTRDTAAAVGLDRRFSGDSEQPTNPAYAVIAVRIAELQTQLAAGESLLARIDSVLANPEQLRLVSGRVARYSVLAPARLPQRADGPGRVTVAVIAALLGLFLAVLFAFVHHALQPAASARTVPSGTTARSLD